MSGRRSSDDEHAALLQPPSGESSSRRPSEQQAQQQSVRLSTHTAKDQDDDDSHRLPRPPPPGRCSKSATVSMVLVLAILGGMLVFLLLTPPKNRHPVLVRLTNYTRESQTSEWDRLNTTGEGEDEEEEGGRKAGLHVDKEESRGQPKPRKMSRIERIEGWFMKRPKRSPSDYILFGNEPLEYVVFLRSQIRGWNGADMTKLEGEANITLKHTDGDPRRIELNSLHNMIMEVNAYDLSQSEAPIECKFVIDLKRERLIIKTERPMERGGHYKLQIYYRSTPDKRMRGAYESWIWDEAEQQKVYSLHVTNQPMDVRRWLPCFDEPKYKVPLTLIIGHPSGLNVLANSGVEWEYTPSQVVNRTVTAFYTTPPLPSYLYSFSINNYQQFSMVKDGVNYSTYLGRRGEMYGERTLWNLVYAVGNISALHPGQMLLSPANGTGYTKKFDMIYTPDHTGAMENQGLVICDDNRLVVGGEGDWMMVLHEVAHHIFGNQLTLSWWSDTWMNEGLATKAEFEADCALRLGDSKGEMRRIKEDAYYQARSEPTMRVDVYEGALMLRMLSKWDAVAYDKTIEFLFTKHSRGSISQRLFCDLFGRFSTSNASTLICDDFSFNTNYPILVVSKKKGGYEVRQRRFHRGRVDETYRDETTRWTIPLSIRWKIPHSDVWGPAEKRVMRREDDVIFIEADAPIVINGDGHYYYRVIYDDYTPFYATRESLARNMAWRLIQMKLVDDATAALLTDYLDPFVGFRFVVYSGLDMPQFTYFEWRFQMLLYGHLYRQAIDEWRVMDIVEQLFLASPRAPPEWGPRQSNSSCRDKQVNTVAAVIDSYTKGTLFHRIANNPETHFFTECARSINISRQQAIDWIWSALSAYDDTIRSKDVNTAVQVAVRVLGTVDEAMRAINHKAYDIKISDDDFSYFISRLFNFFSAKLNLITINQFVKLRPESMRTQWNFVARSVEEERMDDLEYKKVGPRVLEALLTVLHDEKGFDVAQLIRTSDPEEKVRRRGMRNKPKGGQESLAETDVIYPLDIQEGFNEEMESSTRRKRQPGMANPEAVNGVSFDAPF